MAGCLIEKWKSMTLSACIYHWLGEQDMLILWVILGIKRCVCLFIYLFIYLKKEITITWKKFFKEHLVPFGSYKSVFKSCHAYFLVIHLLNWAWSLLKGGSIWRSNSALHWEYNVLNTSIRTSSRITGPKINIHIKDRTN